MLVSGRATQSWLKRQHVSHIRTVQPKELCRVVLIDAVRVSVYTVRPAQQPATAKVPDAGSNAVLSNHVEVLL